MRSPFPEMIYVTTAFAPLDAEERDRIGFLRHTIESRSTKTKALLVYRGDSICRLAQRLNSSEAGRETLFERLFYFGEKARHFFADNRPAVQLTYLRTINDCSTETIKFIFDRVAKVVTTQEHPWCRQVSRHTSEKFCDFFARAENREDFVKRMESAKTSAALLMARDYIFTSYTSLDGPVCLKKRCSYPLALIGKSHSNSPIRHQLTNK